MERGKGKGGRIGVMGEGGKRLWKGKGSRIMAYFSYFLLCFYFSFLAMGTAVSSTACLQLACCHSRWNRTCGLGSHGDRQTQETSLSAIDLLWLEFTE